MTLPYHMRIYVARMKLVRIFPLVLTAALLGGCASKPVLLNASPEGVVVRYDPMFTTAAAAKTAAQAFCARYHRIAVVGASSGTAETFTSFACVKP